MSTRDDVTALRRFGLGVRPGDLKQAGGDPRGSVLAQLADSRAALLDDPDLEPSHVVFAEAQRAQAQQRAQREMQKAAGAAPALPPAQGQAPQGGPLPPTAGNNSPGPPEKNAGAIRRDAFQDEIAARVHRAITTETPLLERLVYFWSNHFCVSAAKGAVRGIAGAYEREVIRPHVLGRFGDMLKASAQHPAMLIYLDNQVSIGPSSVAGKARARGLNENLAREILELHTVGVDAGYTQEDVTNLARIITGWTIGVISEPTTVPGKFFYASRRHEPGAWTVLGKRYEDRGLQSGEDALRDLARHPATGRHIARKLARHFVSDQAPETLIDRLARTFTESEGDLAAVTRALVSADAAWEQRPRKVVPPFDFAVSLVRGLGVRPKAQEVHRVAASLGQPTWTVASPKGWPDDDDAWMGPAAVRERLRIAEFVARQVDRVKDPRTVATELLGGAASGETLQAIARAETREQGFELLIMSPELLRR